jgi:hypothetical protein
VIDVDGLPIMLRSLTGAEQRSVRVLLLELLDGVGDHGVEMVEYPDTIRIIKRMSANELQSIVEGQMTLA